MADIPTKSFYSISKFMPKGIDILKVSHHGAKRTVDDYILKRLHPKYSIILTGKNPYNHPDIETVAKLQKYTTVLATNELGAIKFIIKKNEITPYIFQNKRFEKFE